MQNTVLNDTPALAIDNVVKIYSQWQRSGEFKDIIKNLIQPQKKEIRALDNISLQILKGEFMAYAGANGAGKSTTIKILSGILQPTEGKVSVMGLDPAKDRIPLMKKIGVLFGQRTELWWDAPVIASYHWKKDVWNIPEDLFKRNLEMITELLDLKDILYTFSRELSLGQRMRADLGMLLLHSPEVIFLDEPTLGLDVLAKKQMIEFLRKINRENKTTIIVTSHDMDDLEQMAERIVLLSKGKIIFDGDFDKLRISQNSLARIKITCANPPSDIKGIHLISQEKGSYEYQFDNTKLSLNMVLTQLAKAENISDIEIKKTPIEDVISDLYLKLR